MQSNITSWEEAKDSNRPRQVAKFNALLSLPRFIAISPTRLYNTSVQNLRLSVEDIAASLIKSFGGLPERPAPGRSAG
jgi:hypothetical protein